MNSFKKGLLYEAYAREVSKEPISSGESTVTFKGNSGIGRSELVKEGYLKIKEVRGKNFYLLTKKGRLFVQRGAVVDFLNENNWEWLFWLRAAEGRPVFLKLF